MLNAIIISIIGRNVRGMKTVRTGMAEEFRDNSRCGFSRSFWAFPTTFSMALLVVILLVVSPGCNRGDNPTEASRPHAQEITREVREGPLRVRTTVDKDTITIAESLTLTIEAEVESGYGVELPAFGEKLGELGITDYREEGPLLASEGRVITRKIYKLEPFLSGDYTISPMKVSFWKKVSEAVGQDSAAGRDSEAIAPVRHEINTEALLVKVQSLLGDARGELELNPLSGPVDLPVQMSLRLIVTVALGIIVFCVGGAFFWYRRRKKLAAEAEATVIPPHELAYRQLRDIYDEKLLERGELKIFFSRISDVMRFYIENRFGLRAPKSTTEEFLAAISREAPFSLEHRRLLNAFLRNCDLVKFAEHQPTPEETQMVIEACKAFIEATTAL